VVAKSTKAVNYRYRMGSTRLDFRGTALAPTVTGRADVESKAGRMEVQFEIRGMEGATKFGAEYLTYVLWAITPEGRPQNLGEVQLSGGRGKLTVTTELQAFGLIVTAEPYFAVTMPSDLIVAENEVRPDTLGRIETIDAKYELLQRGEYAKMANPLGLALDPRVPLELFQARNALMIAKGAQAGKYAPEILSKAEASLQQAEEYQARKRSEAKPAAMMARDAVQRAEDARAVAVKRAEEERLENERKAAEARELAAKKAAEEEALRRAAAEEQQRIAEEQRKKAELERKAEEERRVAAELERARAETERLKAQAAQAEAEKKRMEAELAAAKLAQERAAAEAEQRAALERAKAQEEAAAKLVAEAKAAAERAEAEKLALRARLFQQFNQVLETRDSERGLVVNLGDLLFDVGKATLRADAREKLARLSGMVLAHAGLKLEAEGHTDATGSDALNQRLSEQRAETVRAYLEAQGIAAANLTARGFGKEMPVADNTTAKGRQQNRRVEVIVSGEIIGTKLGGRAL
jgi:outer membrane protein OmpA-like peptidoglycan-associated protein